MTHPDRSTQPLTFLQNGIAQVALVVPDLDRAVEAWWTRLGIGPWHFYTYGKPLVKSMAYRGQPTEYTMRLALANIGSLRIELIEAVSGSTVYDEFIKKHSYGVQHFGLLVEDMPSALTEAAAAGYEVTMEGSGFGLDGDGHYAYLETEDLLGVTLELIERPQRRHPPEKVYPPPDAS